MVDCTLAEDHRVSSESMRINRLRNVLSRDLEQTLRIRGDCVPTL